MIEIRSRKTGRLRYRSFASTLAGADLRGARLLGADLGGVDLSRADLSGADLRESNLAGADLTGAALRHALLFEADLRGAIVRGTDLRGAHLWRTKLAGVDLTGADLTGAWCSKGIRWPEGFESDAAGTRLWGAERTDVARLYLEEMGDVPRRVIWWCSHHLYFHFGSEFSHPRDFERLGIRLNPPLSDWLEVGPQQVDLACQALLRQEYYRESECPGVVRRDLEGMEICARALAEGECVLFWCDPELGSCLSILWALDILSGHGADLGNAFLLLWPTTAGDSPPAEPETRRAFRELVPVPEVLDALVRVRRHLASDSDEVVADLSGLPTAIREWGAVTGFMADYLPDERGLDVADGHLINHLTEEWQSESAIWDCFPMPREPGWGVLYRERLQELGGDFGPSRPEGGGAPSVFPAEYRTRTREGRDVFQFRLTEYGRRVREGGADLLSDGHFCRWVGGRLVSRERPLRRAWEKVGKRGVVD